MFVAVIGGGAAGFFSAVNCAIAHPGRSVVIFEKSGKVLSKVRVSGGGRCNVTNGFFDESLLEDYYPRGFRELRNAFSVFSKKDTVEWFESRGVRLKTEADGRMFPITDNSETIIRCLFNEAAKHGVEIKLNHAVRSIRKDESGKFTLEFQNAEPVVCEKVIITSGGNPSAASYEWLERLNHTIVTPVPSLFTFNLPASPLKGLEGTSFSAATVSLEGFRKSFTGPILITHWGLSGPVVLRLSAFAARWLNEKNYEAVCRVKWVRDDSEDETLKQLQLLKSKSGNRKIYSHSWQDLSSRLWQRICFMSGIQEGDNWADVRKESVQRLLENLFRMPMSVKGKTTFREEFVTCGGIDLREVNMKTMESRKMPGIYFAGEVLDVDGITGGFNFQSAWTTGYLAGTNC